MNMLDLPMFGFDIIYADPPWSFDNYSEKGEGRNPNQHYETMTIDEIKALPIGSHLAAGDSVLFMWATDPILDQAIDVMKAWGFKYVTVAFVWAKRNKRDKFFDWVKGKFTRGYHHRPDQGWFMGTGYYTRANPEYVLLGTSGQPGGVADRAVRQLIIEPVREHSRKPDRIYNDIEKLFPNRRYIELFARNSRPGWVSWGNQVDLFDQLGEGDKVITRKQNMEIDELDEPLLDLLKDK